VNSSQAVKENERFFHFNYTSPAILDILEKIQSGITLPSLIDYIFILLDDQTTYFLERIRKYRIPELRNSTDEIFTNFTKSISNAPSQLVKQVSLAHQQSLSDWFDWGGEAASDFTVASALEQAYSLVESLHPSANFKKELEDCSTHVFDKNEYSSFVSILVLIKENVVKHAGFSLDFSVVDFFKEQSGTLHLKFSNVINSNSKRIAQKKLSKINSNLGGEIIDLASQDSSSGIYKIKLILNYKLNYQSRIKVGVEGNQFYIDIKIEV
jgi:hypothetical protein